MTLADNVHIIKSKYRSKSDGFRGLKLKLRYTMTNSAGTIVCESSSEHCFLTRDGRFIRISNEYPEFLEDPDRTGSIRLMNTRKGVSLTFYLYQSISA